VFTELFSAIQIKRGVCNSAASQKINLKHKGGFLFKSRKKLFKLIQKKWQKLLHCILATQLKNLKPAFFYKVKINNH